MYPFSDNDSIHIKMYCHHLHQMMYVQMIEPKGMFLLKIANRKTERDDFAKDNLQKNLFLLCMNTCFLIKILAQKSTLT